MIPGHVPEHCFTDSTTGVRHHAARGSATRTLCGESGAISRRWVLDYAKESPITCVLCAGIAFNMAEAFAIGFAEGYERAFKGRYVI